MSDAVSVAELEGQHAELLPGRTVLSLFSGSPAAVEGVGAVGAATVSCRQVRDRPAIGRRCPEFSVDLVSGYVFEKRCGSR